MSTFTYWGRFRKRSTHKDKIEQVDTKFIFDIVLEHPTANKNQTFFGKLNNESCISTTHPDAVDVNCIC